MNLPNRKERRKLAKKLGLFSNKKSKKDKNEQLQKTQSIGKLIHLRNLTEQRNSNKK